MIGDQLKAEMMKEENKKKPYLIIFKKVDVEDKPLMAANDN